MGDYLGEHLPVIAAAAIVTLLATPLFRWLSFKVGAVKAPDERRVHTRPTALLGGAAILVGFLAGLATAWQVERFAEVFVASSVPLGVVIGAVLMLRGGPEWKGGVLGKRGSVGVELGVPRHHKT